MADVTVQNASGVTFTFQQGDTDRVRSVITANPDQLSIPGSGPGAAFLFDFEGPIKAIEISGELTEASTSRTSSGTTTTILQQKQWLEENLNGLQVATNFTSTYETQSYDGSSFTQTKIMWGQMSFEEIAGDPEALPFTATLLVGL